MADEQTADEREIAEARAAWAAWEAAGKPYPVPAVREPLTLAEAAAKYGTYPTERGPVPILHAHVRLLDFACQHCGEPAESVLEYGGFLACSRECGALGNPEHDSTWSDPAKVARAERALAMRSRRTALAAELAAVEAEMRGEA